MIKAIVTLMFMFLVGISLHAIEGTYNVTGYDPYEKESYTGTLVIFKGKNGVYEANWILKEGGKQYQNVGTGLVRGNQASFVFKTPPGEREIEEGLQLYTIEGDTLEGPFVLLNKNLIGHEKLEKVSR